MKDYIENTPRVEAQDDDIIVLGVASTDTHGIGVTGESNGVPMLPGISEE